MSDEDCYSLARATARIFNAAIYRMTRDANMALDPYDIHRAEQARQAISVLNERLGEQWTLSASAASAAFRNESK